MEVAYETTAVNPWRELGSMSVAKRNILIVTELYPNADNPFIGTFVSSQINELRKYHRIVLIVPYLISFSRRASKHQPSHIQEKNVDIYYFKQYPFWILIPRIFKLLTSQAFSFLNKKYVSRKILRLAKKLHSTYHFSLVHGHESYIGDEAGVVGKKLGIPSIVTIHGLYDYHKLGFGERVMNIVVRNLNLATRLFAVSKIAASSYQKN